ncbi:rust resistance kinase Lr10-like isoform X2 [Herrania umbratica]|uniref:Rust resistance kinase Lr10-like isoform X2 n=1 Tax=Herrania umbratica TaxID=108875 RepID=A0A6J1ANL6_9ROSI|nr:rust resistance kinase Lr10-like isoform X2 [Herrania umbratica]
MLRAKLPLLGLLALALSHFPDFCIARGKHCGSSFCGNINISYPFRLKSQPRSCGNRKLELECDDENNSTIFPMKYGNFYVQDISYSDRTIQLLDVSLGNDNCSIPHSSYPWYTPFAKNLEVYRSTPDLSIMFLVNCTTQINDSSVYIDAFRCTNTPSPQPPSLYFLDGETINSDFHESCRIEAQVPIMLANITGLSTSDIYTKLLTGFQLSWFSYADDNWTLNILQWVATLLSVPLDIYIQGNLAFFLGSTSLPRFVLAPSKGTQIICVAITGIIVARTLLGISGLIALVIHKLRRRHLSMDDMIENFLQSQNNLMPIRYSYSEVKRMTGDFKIKLGQGGYGSVFKGKLRSGREVAIKLLSKSKANGQDFINEVATIGRIHHVNVVQLIGFCVEGSKQALVYDFMVNGSLDKIIFSTGNNTLSWQKIFEIALGVARGIDYLHRGCEMQILHFDIKPHNILLDENFRPKVSDFGLAKLYSVDDNIVSLTAARGTLGYIAPELFYKNIGGVSYKADVYSFGMMLIEMVGRRKNLNPFAEHSSQIYFPSWIYNQFDHGDDIELGDVTESENKIVKKVVIVAFWCIQTKPTDRPSMSEVLKMLESELELPAMPPKPFLFSQETSTKDHASKNSRDETTTDSENIV